MMQNSCKIVGLTGGIATGKSTVTNLLVENGFKVIDADKIAREVVEVNCPAYKDIVEEFGTKVLNEDFTIDRKKLGDIIFNDKEEREKLNSIVHPRVFYEMKNRISSYCGDEQVIFLDIPLLIEGLNLFKKNDINIDEIWLVYTDEEIQIKRLMQRDKLSYEDAKKRIDSQLPMGTKMKYATRIINNNKDIKELKNTLENMLIRFK